MLLVRVTLTSVAGLFILTCCEKSHSGGEQKRTTQNEAQQKPDNAPRTAESSREEGKTAAAPDEASSEPEADQIGEDCLGFVRSTKLILVNAGKTDCPECPPVSATTEVLKFDSVHVDEVTSSGSICEVAVTIRATFNPGAGGENIAGGLTGWISPEQKGQYLRGKTPPGQQVYMVKITYRNRGTGWRAVEFN